MTPSKEFPLVRNERSRSGRYRFLLLPPAQLETAGQRTKGTLGVLAGLPVSVWPACVYVDEMSRVDRRNAADSVSGARIGGGEQRRLERWPTD